MYLKILHCIFIFRLNITYKQESTPNVYIYSIKSNNKSTAVYPSPSIKHRLFRVPWKARGALHQLALRLPGKHHLLEYVFPVVSCLFVIFYYLSLSP